MKSKTTTYIVWILVAFALIGGGILLFRGGAQTVEDKTKARQNFPTGNETPEEIGGPYITTGEEAEDSNFFIEGRVESLPALAEPDKNGTVVWVSAVWCEICRSMRSFVWKSANKYADQVALKEIDLEDNPHVAAQQRVLGTPTFFVLDRNGNEVARFNGATQIMFESQLEKASQQN